MRYTRAVAAATAGLAATALLAAPVAAEEDEVLPLHVEPTSGPVGTVIDVAGEGCIDESEPGEVLFVLFDAEYEPLDFDFTDADAEGAWAGQLVVPEGTPPGPDYIVTAACVESGGWEEGDLEEEALAEEAPLTHVEEPEEFFFVLYEEVPFEVTGDTTPDTTPPADDEEKVAAPAVPVVAQPTFTG